MRTRSPRSALVCAFATLLCLQRVVAAETVDGIVQSIEAINSQQAEIRFNLAETALFHTAITSDSGQDKVTESNLFVLNADGGLHVSQTKTQDGPPLTIVTVANREYGAVLTNSKAVQPIGDTFNLSGLRDVSFQLSDCFDSTEARYLPDWLADSAVRAISSRYFDIGNMRFADALSEWKSNGGTVEFTEARNERDTHKLEFHGWPIFDDGKASYRIDPSSMAITRLAGGIDGMQVTLIVDEFLRINGVPFPAVTTLQIKRPDGSKLVKSSAWHYGEYTSLGFDKQMLELEYYGIAAPNFDGNNSLFVWIIGGIVIVACLLLAIKAPKFAKR